MGGEVYALSLYTINTAAVDIVVHIVGDAGVGVALECHNPALDDPDMQCSLDVGLWLEDGRDADVAAVEGCGELYVEV